VARVAHDPRSGWLIAISVFSGEIGRDDADDRDPIAGSDDGLFKFGRV
jgi:hypothetical protein